MCFSPGNGFPEFPDNSLSLAPSHSKDSFSSTSEIDNIMGLFFTAVGLMMIFEGVPYFCFPNQFKELARKIPDTPNSTLRTIGFFIMILGLGVVYLGRSIHETP